jgi:hypothetical protein
MSESMKSSRLLKEFAIDPDCFPTFDQFQRIAQNVGIGIGRYIADIPRSKWLESVRSILRAKFPDRAKEIEIELDHLCKANGLIATRNSECLTWIEAAITEQLQRPFDALVTNNEQVPTRIAPECLSTRSGPWHVESGDRIQKNALEIAKFASSLFHVSAEIKLVDAYFHPKKKRYTESLRVLANEAANCRQNYDRFEYHCLIDRSYIKRANEQGKEMSESDWIREFEADCHDYLPRIIPHGFSISVVVWDKNPSGETMHSRYIMSDIAAIKIDYGLDESDAEVSTDIDLVPARVHRTRWDDLRLNSRTYRLAKSVSIIGTFR